MSDIKYCIAVLFISVLTSNTLASENNHATEQLDYYVVAQPATLVKKGIEKLTGAEIEIIGRLRGTLTNIHLSGDVEAIITQFADTVNAKWWKRGNSYVIATRMATVTRFVPKQASADIIIDELENIGLMTSAVEIDFGESFIRLSGPEEVVEQIEFVLSDIVEAPSFANGKAVFLIRGTTIEKIDSTR